MRNKILTTLLAAGFIASHAPKAGVVASQTASIAPKLGTYKDIISGVEVALLNDKNGFNYKFNFKGKDWTGLWSIVNATSARGGISLKDSWECKLLNASNVKDGLIDKYTSSSGFYSSFDSQNNPASEPLLIAGNSKSYKNQLLSNYTVFYYEYYMIYTDPQTNTSSTFQLDDQTLLDIAAKNPRFVCRDGNGYYEFTLKGSDYLVTAAKKYGFVGLMSSELFSVKPYFSDDYNGLCFIPRAPGEVCLKLGADTYDILNIKLPKDLTKFEHKETDGIKMPIYSSSDRGTPPSLIAKKRGDNTCWLFLLTKGYLKGYEFGDPIELKETDLTALANVSQKKIATAKILGEKYTVSLVGGGMMGSSYLLVKPV